MDMYKWIVKHSKSKYAYNVLTTKLGDKYKRAVCEYKVTGDKQIDDRNRSVAKFDAAMISKAPEMYSILSKIVSNEKVYIKDIDQLIKGIHNIINK